MPLRLHQKPEERPALITEGKIMNEESIIQTARHDRQKKLLPLTFVLLCLLTRSLHAQGFPGDDGWSFPTNLNSWTFGDTNTWNSDYGYAPIAFTNLTSSSMGDIIGGYSLSLDSADPAWLRYNVQEGDGSTNLPVEAGTLSLWFAPSWGSATTNQNGSGPGDWGRLLEVGAYTTNADYGWWSLLFDSGGTNIYFMSQTNSADAATVTHLSAPIDWATNVWHNIVLTYSSTNTALYLDGQLAASGAGISVFPGPEVLANGFGIGSDASGLVQAHGMFDDIFTYDFPLDADAVGSIYYFLEGYFSINIFNVQARISSAPSAPPGPTVFNAISGPGFLQSMGAASSCVTNSEIWITNVTVAITGTGTNLTENCTFTIAGGLDLVPYDVFATAVLAQSDIAYGWAWLGQGYHCNIYSMTNLPLASAYLILGKPLDSDMDGLSDAYERLVSKTDPYNADSDGDGLSDYYEVIFGLPPTTANSTPSLGSISIPTCPVP